MMQMSTVHSGEFKQVTDNKKESKNEHKSRKEQHPLKSECSDQQDWTYDRKDRYQDWDQHCDDHWHTTPTHHDVTTEVVIVTMTSIVSALGMRWLVILVIIEWNLMWCLVVGRWC
jgi:hypothetical protein